MTTINIDKREVTKTNRNKRINTSSNSGISFNSTSSNGSVIGSTDWENITNKPTIYSTIATLTDYSSFFSEYKALAAIVADSANAVDWNNITFKPNTFPITAGSNYYIQNQYDIAQSADMWINGKITGDSIISAGTFVSGFAGSGTKLNLSDNSLTLDTLTVRGEMNVYELVINKIRASNGSIWVSDAVKLVTVDSPVSTTQYCYVNDQTDITFTVNDVVKAQTFTGRSIKVASGIVSAISGTKITITLDNSNNPFWSGAEVVRIGNTSNTDRQGALYLTSSDTNSPYLDVLNGVTSNSFSGKTKVRLGRLDGITDANFGTLSGYGLYCQNGYFTGQINVTGGNASTKAYVDTAQSNTMNICYNDATNKMNNAISTASSDATTKANNAQSTAINTASNDATNKMNSAISTAATDATTKANSAQSNAVSSSQTFTNNAIADLKSNYLGDLAVLDTLDGGKITDSTVELAKLGTTVITGGLIKTTLLDASAIKSTIINTGYIEGLSLNFTQGLIGGWNINSTYLAKDNGTNSAGLSPSDYPFYAGDTYANRATAPFRVSNTGEINISSKFYIKNYSTNCEVLAGGVTMPFGSGSGALYAKGTAISTDTDTNAIQAVSTGGYRNYAIYAQSTSGFYNTAVYAQAVNGIKNTAIKAEGNIVISNGGIELSGGGADSGYNGSGITYALQNISSLSTTMSSDYRIFVSNITSGDGEIYLPYISNFKIGEMIYISNQGNRTITVKSNTSDSATINNVSRSSRWITLYSNYSGATLVKQASNNWIIISAYNIAF